VSYQGKRTMNSEPVAVSGAGTSSSASGPSTSTTGSAAVPSIGLGSSDLVDPSVYVYCDDVCKYDRIAKIGQGTFGEVFKAKHRQSRKVVALKKVLMENEREGFPITALREIKILQLLKHENVVRLIEICRTKETAMENKATFYLVFEFCEHDLAGKLHIRRLLTLSDLRKANHDCIETCLVRIAEQHQRQVQLGRN
jgi:serine/threonine protein kinase